MTPTPRKRRMIMVAAILIGVGSATALAIMSFQNNLSYFFTPSQVAAGEAPLGYPFRVGGLVREGSVKRETGSLTVHFDLTDGEASVPIVYTGVLPDLFREGQGIITPGQLDDGGIFTASEVLAKHDENYMPPEVTDALQKAGKASYTPAAQPST